jgi:hypothetical protein
VISVLLPCEGDDRRGEQALGMLEQIAAIEVAFSLGGAPPADGQQCREPGVSVAIGRPDEQVRGVVGEGEPAADDQLEAGDLPRRLESPHHAGEGVDVGDRHSPAAERGGGVHQFVRVRCALQEREVGDHVELGVVVVAGRDRSRRIDR